MLLATLVDSKFDIELTSELPCPIFNSLPSQSPAISLSSAPQFTLRSSHAHLTQPGVCLVSSLILSSWCWLDVCMWVCVGIGGQNDDQSRWCPFLLITHYCATDLCQNSSSSAEMCTKASINQEGYSSVWSHNPHTSSVPPICLSDSWMYRPAGAAEPPTTLPLRWMKSLAAQWIIHI